MLLKGICILYVLKKAFKKGAIYFYANEDNVHLESFICKLDNFTFEWTGVFLDIEYT